MTSNRTRWASWAFGFAGALAIFGTQAKSNAGVVYDSGAPDQASGNEMSEWIQANEFTLGASDTITGIKFWDIESSPGYDGSISWTIFDDASGSPGTAIAIGNVTAVTRVNTGAVVSGEFDEFVNTFSINETLAGGTYWLGLHNGPIADQNYRSFYWETTSNLSQPIGQELNSPYTGSWGSNGSRHAFQLLDGATSVVPLPTSAWSGLALIGGIGILQIRRKMIAC